MNTYCGYLRKCSYSQDTFSKIFKGKQIKVLTFTNSKIISFHLLKCIFEILTKSNRQRDKIQIDIAFRFNFIEVRGKYETNDQEVL